MMTKRRSKPPCAPTLYRARPEVANNGHWRAKPECPFYPQQRTLALPQEVEHWSSTTLREKLVKIGAKMVRQDTL